MVNRTRLISPARLLAQYHASFVGTPDAAHATYLVTGVSKIPEKDDNKMEVDDVGDEDDEDYVEETKVMIVNEADLAGVSIV